MVNLKRVVGLAIWLAFALAVSSCSPSPVPEETATAEDRSSVAYDFGADPTGWALCVSADATGESLKMFIFYGTPAVAAFAVSGWAFGAEIGEVDVVGSAIVVDIFPLPPIEPGASVEVDATVSLLELSARAGGTIEDRSGSGTAQIQIENTSDRTTCEQAPEVLRFELDVDIEMSDGSRLSLVVDGATQPNWP